MPMLPLVLALAAFQPPATASLTLAFPPELRLNRAAPNLLTLTHPWGTLALVPVGVPDPQDPVHYLTRLGRLTFPVRVPAATPPGDYPVRLNAELYLCSQRAGLCYRKSLSLPARLAVGPAARPTSLKLTAAQLQPSARGLTGGFR